MANGRQLISKSIMQSQASNNEVDKLINNNSHSTNTSGLNKRLDDQLIGNTIAGRYEVLDLIGFGGFGSVYRAKQLSLNKIVALKILRPEYIEDKKIAARFQHEARIASNILVNILP